jgi:hypothetical protein
VRFVENAGDTLSEHFRDYRVQLAGALALMAGALASPLWARRRDALAASGVALVLVGAWTVAPYTGMAAQPVFSELDISTIRYLLPAALACAVAVAIGARAPGRTARTGALLVLTGAATWNVVEDVRAGFPYVPSAFTLLAALAAGAVVALAAGGLLRHRLLVATASPALVLAAALALALGADGYLDRHVDTGFGDAGVVAWFATRPGFADDTRQIAQAPIVNGLLAGDRLRHPVPLIAPNEPCTRVRERTAEGWVVVARSPFPEYDAIARRIEACLSDTPLAYADPGYRVYGPPG